MMLCLVYELPTVSAAALVLLAATPVFATQVSGIPVAFETLERKSKTAVTAYFRASSSLAT